MRELEVSRRTLMRDLDFLRDDHHAPIAYDESRKGVHLTDRLFRLAPVELTQREVFAFSIVRRLLARFEGTRLEMDLRSVLSKIGDSLQGTVSLDVESLTDQFTVLSEGHAVVDPEVWQGAARGINQRQRLRLPYVKALAPQELRERVRRRLQQGLARRNSGSPPAGWRRSPAGPTRRCAGIGPPAGNHLGA